MNWIHLSEGRSQLQALRNLVMNLRVPWKFMNYFSSLETIDFLRRALPWATGFRKHFTLYTFQFANIKFFFFFNFVANPYKQKPRVLLNFGPTDADSVTMTDKV